MPLAGRAMPRKVSNASAARVLAWLAGAVLWFCVLPVQAQAPQSSAPAQPPISAAQVEDLIHVIEDPVQRERLLQQLRLLVEANKAAEPAAQQAAPVVAAIASVSTRLEDLQGDALAVAGRVAALPQLIESLRAEWRKPEARARWRDVALSLLVIVGVGYAVHFVARRILRPLRNSLAQRQAPTVRAKFAALAGLLVLDYLAIAAFAVGSFFAAGLLTIAPPMRLAALGWINAIVAARVLVVTGRAVFAARVPALRVWRISDETAQYAEQWVRRIAVTLIYGFFVLQLAVMLGLDEAVHGGLRRLLGLVLLGMVIVLILQNRQRVAEWIARPGKALRMANVRRRIASIWHIVIIAYAVGAYGVWAMALRDGFAMLARGSAITLAACVVGYFLLQQADRGFQYMRRADARARQRLPVLPSHTLRYLPLLRTLVRGAIFLLVALTVLQAWGVNTYDWLASDTGRALAATVLRIIVIVGVSLLVWELTSLFIERRLTAQDQASGNYLTSARTRTLLTVARKTLALALVVIGSLLVLTELGLNIAPLLATAGVLGVAVGFGSQKLVQDVITGVFILLEDLFAVGDVIKVGDTAGQVEAVSIRNVRLRDFSGTVHTIPFSTITTVSNLTRDYSYYVFNIGVAYSEDVDRAMAVLKEIGEEMRQDPHFGSMILAPFELVGVDRFSEAGVIIQARFKTQPLQQWNVGREFNRRLKKRFDELGIELSKGPVVNLATPGISKITPIASSGSDE